MDQYQQIKDNTVIGPREIGPRTRSFINTSDSRTLRGTLYSVDQQEFKKLPGLSRAKSFTLNSGKSLAYAEEEIISKGLSNVPEYEGLREKVEVYQHLERSGVQMNTYGDPFSKTGIHTKLYTAEFDGKKKALVSTGNISRSAMSGLDRKDFRDENLWERFRRVSNKAPKGTFNQHNLAVEYSDPAIVGEIDAYLKTTNSGLTGLQGKHLQKGQRATNSIIRQLTRSGKGDRISVISPYVDNERVAAAMVSAKQKGADVELITGGDIQSGNSKARRRLISRLKGSGVRVLDEGNRGMLHAKAVAIKKKDGTYLSAIGSSNLTEASTGNATGSGYTEDVMIFEKGKQGSTSQEIFEQVNSQFLKDEIALYKSPIKKGEKYGRVERKSLARGLTSYRLGEKNNLAYLPTSMDAEFFSQYQGKKLPTYLTPYSDIYESRTGYRAPSAVRSMDQALMTPGIGGQVNYFTGREFYREGKGVIGSGFHSAGASLDNLLGFQKHKEEKEVLSGKRSGSVRDFFKFRDREDNDDIGIFEWAAGTTIDLARNLSEAIGTYIIVNLPLQHLKAELSSKWMKDLLEADPAKAHGDNWSKLKKRGSRFLRNVAFGPEYGGVLSDSIEAVEAKLAQDPSSRATVPDEVSKKLNELRRNGGYNPQGLLSNTFTDEGKLRGHLGWDKAGGFVSGTMAAFRRFEKARYDDVLKPILQAINPYTYGSSNYNEFNSVVKEVGDVIGQGPSISYQGVGGTVPSHLKLENVGSERITTTYKAFDKLGALLPFNPVYWFPGLRKSLNLPEFDPSQQMTWNRAWPLEQSSRFAQNTLSYIKEGLTKPKTILRRAKNAWKTNAKVGKLQKDLEDLNKAGITDISRGVYTVDPNGNVSDELQGLMNSAQHTYGRASEQVENVLGSKQYQDYVGASRQLNREYALMMGGFQDSTMGAEPYADVPHRGSSISNNAETFKRGRRIRNTLIATGSLLFLDQVVERSMMGSGPSIITQLKAAFSMKDPEDGSRVGRFEFEGVAPNFAMLTGLAGGFAAGGLLFPEFVETGRGAVDFSDHQRFQEEINYQRAQLGDEVPTKGSRGLRGKIDYYNNAKKNLRSHKHLRFSKGNAAITGLMVGLGVQIGSSILAGVSNTILNTGGPIEAVGRGIGSIFGFDNKEEGVSLEGSSAIFSMILENTLSKKIDSSEGGSADIRQLTLAKTLLEHSLVQEKEVGRVFSMATQLPLPFFQVSGVARNDPFKDNIELSVGLQYTPTAGLGINPILPIGIRTKARELTKEEMDYYKRRRLGNINRDPDVNPLSTWEQLQLKGLGMIQTISGANPNTAGMKGNADSGYLNVMDFIGVATLSSAAYNLFDRSPAKGHAINFFRKRERFKKEMNSLKKELGPLGKIVKSVYGVGSNMASNLLSLPINFIRTFPRAVGEFIAREGQMKGIEETTPKTEAGRKLKQITSHANSVKKVTDRVLSSRHFRRGAVTLGILRLVTNWSQPGGGATTEFDDPIERFQGILGAGSIMSFLALKSGAFASQEEMAAKFLADNRIAYKKKELNRILNNVAGDSNLNAVAKAGSRMTPPRQRGNSGMRLWNPVRRLQADIASQYLVEQSWKQSGKDISLMSKPSGLRSMSGRFSLLAGALLLPKIASHGILSILPKSTADNLVNIPFIGETLRYFSGYKEDEYNIFDEYREEDDHAATKFLGFMSRTLTLGMFDVADKAGLYTDKSDPYISSFGPFGQSEKDGDLKLYAQFSGDISDISSSSYTMMKKGLGRILREDEIVSLLNGNDTLETVVNKALGTQYRNKAMTISTVRNSVRNAAPRLTSRAIAIQQFRMEHLANQTVLGIELMQTANWAASGAIPEKSSKEGLLNPLWSIDDTFSSYEHRLHQYGKGVESVTARQMFMGTVKGYQKDDKRVNAIDLLSPFFNLGKDDLNLPEPIQGITSFILTIGSLLPMTLAAAGVITSGFTTVGAIARSQGRKEIIEMAENSPLYNQAKAVQPERFSYIEVNSGGKTRVVQIDNRSGTTVGSLLNIEDVNQIEGARVSATTGQRRKGASVIQGAYSQWGGAVNKFFSNTVYKSFSDVIEAKYNPDGSVDWDSVKTSLKSSRSQFDAVLNTRVTSNNHSIFDLLFSQSSSDAPDSLLKELFDDEKMVDRLVDEVREGWERNNLDDPEMTLRETKVRLMKMVEETETYRQMRHRLVNPTSASYETGVEPTRQELNRAKRYYKKQIKKIDGSWKVDRSQFQPVSQTLTQGTMRGAYGAGNLGIQWMATGKSIYEIVEGTAVALDRDKGYALRKKGAEQAARSSLYEGIGIGAQLSAQFFTSKLTFIPRGIASFLSIGAGIAAEYGLGNLIHKNPNVRSWESSFNEAVSSFITKPRATIENAVRKVGFDESAANLLGGTAEVLFKPVQWTLEGLASITTTLVENTVVPFLVDQWDNMATDSTPIKLAKSFVLPRTSYHNLELGIVKEQALARYKRAMQVNRSLSRDTVHPLLLGAPMDYRESQMNDMYFKGSGRLLTKEFGVHNYRPSNLLRLALERQQGLYDQEVIGSSTMRLGPEYDFSRLGMIASGITAGIISMVYNKREGLRHLITGSNSKRVQRAAAEEISDLRKSLGLDNETSVDFNKTRRLGMEGWFQTQQTGRHNITLSSSVENILGRGRLGGVLEGPGRGMHMKSRFIALHEMSHSLQFTNSPSKKNLMSTDGFKTFLNQIGLKNSEVQKIDRTLHYLSLESAQKFALENGITDQATFNNIYQKELEANRTAVSYVSDRTNNSAKGSDVKKLERQLRLKQGTINQLDDPNMFQYHANAGVAEYDFNGKRLYRSSKGTANRKPLSTEKLVYKAGLRNIKNLPGGIVNNIGKFISPIDEVEQANIDRFIDSIFTDKYNRTFKEVFSSHLPPGPGIGFKRMSDISFKMMITSNRFIPSKFKDESGDINKTKDRRNYNSVIEFISEKTEDTFYNPLGHQSQVEAQLRVSFIRNLGKRWGQDKLIQRTNYVRNIANTLPDNIVDKNFRSVFIQDFSKQILFKNNRINELNDLYKKLDPEALARVKEIEQQMDKEIHQFINKLEETFKARDAKFGTNSWDKITRILESELEGSKSNAINNEKRGINHMRDTFKRIVDVAEEYDSKELQQQFGRHVEDNLDLVLRGLGGQSKGVLKGILAVGLEGVKRFGKAIVKPFKPVAKPVIGAFKNLSERFKRYAFGAADVFKTLDMAFTVLDTKYGYDTIKLTNSLRANSSTEEFVKAAEDRIAAKSSTFGGVGVNFLTGSPVLSLATGILTLWGGTGLRLALQQDSREDLKDFNNRSTVGRLLVSGTKAVSSMISNFMKFVFKKDIDEKSLREGILFGDWTGFGKRMAEKDREKLQRGDAVYAQFGSAAVYIRAHKSMEAPSSATRTFIGTAIDSFVVKPVKGALSTVFKKAILPVIKPVIGFAIRKLLPIAVMTASVLQPVANAAFQISKQIGNVLVKAANSIGNKVANLGAKAGSFVQKHSAVFSGVGLATTGLALYFGQGPLLRLLDMKVSDKEKKLYQELKNKENLSEEQLKKLEALEAKRSAERNMRWAMNGASASLTLGGVYRAGGKDVIKSLGLHKKIRQKLWEAKATVKNTINRVVNLDWKTFKGAAKRVLKEWLSGGIPSYVRKSANIGLKATSLYAGEWVWKNDDLSFWQKVASSVGVGAVSIAPELPGLTRSTKDAFNKHQIISRTKQGIKSGAKHTAKALKKIPKSFYSAGLGAASIVALYDIWNDSDESKSDDLIKKMAMSTGVVGVNAAYNLYRFKQARDLSKSVGKGAIQGLGYLAKGSRNLARGSWNLGKDLARGSWNLGKDLARGSWNLVKGSWVERLAKDSWNLGKGLAKGSWNLAKYLAKGSWVGDLARGSWNLVKGSWVERLAKDSWNLGKGLAKDSWNLGKGLAKDSWNLGKGLAEDSWNLAKDLARGSRNLVKGSWVERLAKGSWNLGKDLVKGSKRAGSKIKQSIINSAPKISQSIKNASSRIGQSIRNNSSRIKQFVQGGATKIKQVITDTAPILKQKIGKTIGWLNNVSTSRRLARYGIGMTAALSLILSDKLSEEEDKLNKTDKYTALGVMGGVTLLPEITKVAGKVAKFGKKASNYLGAKTSKLVKHLGKPGKMFANRILTKGVWQSSLDVASVGFDILGIGSSILNAGMTLGKRNNTRADYERQSVMIKKAFASLEGSIYGTIAAGNIGELFGTIGGSLLAQPNQDEVDTWYEARTSGWTIASKEARDATRRMTLGATAASKLNKLANAKAADWFRSRARKEAIRQIAEVGVKGSTREIDYLTSMKGKKSAKKIVDNASTLNRAMLRGSRGGLIGWVGRNINKAAGKAAISMRVAKEQEAVEMLRRLDEVNQNDSLINRYVDPSTGKIDPTKAQRIVDMYDKKSAKSSGFLTKLLTKTYQAKRRGSQVVENSSILSKLKGIGKGAVGLGKSALRGIPFLGDALDVGLFTSGVSSLWKNDDWNDWKQGSSDIKKARYIENYSRATSSIYSLAGSGIGALTMNPALGAGLSIGGGILGDPVGKHIGKKAYENKVSSKSLVSGSTVGALAGVAAGIGIAVLTVATGGIGLAVAAGIAGLLGGATGWTAGGYITATSGGTTVSTGNHASQRRRQRREDRAKRTAERRELGKEIPAEDGFSWKSKTKQFFDRKLQTVTRYLFGYNSINEAGKKTEEKEVKEEKTNGEKGIFMRTMEAMTGFLNSIKDTYIEGIENIVDRGQSAWDSMSNSVAGASHKFKETFGFSTPLGGYIGGTPTRRYQGDWKNQDRRVSQRWYEKTLKDMGFPQLSNSVTSGIGRRWKKLHSGVDYDVGNDAPLYVPFKNGRVVSAGSQSGYGNVVKIEQLDAQGNPTGRAAFFAHLNQINVRVGDKVDYKTVFGTQGNTGRSGGSHVHHESRIRSSSGGWNTVAPGVNEIIGATIPEKYITLGKKQGGGEHWFVQPFFSALQKHEAGGAGYDAFNTGSAGEYSGTTYKQYSGKALTSMTVGEVRNLQENTSLHATGFLQIIGGTLQGRIDAGDVNRNDMFTRETQRGLVISLMKARPYIWRAITDPNASEEDIAKAADQFSMEWSFVGNRGKGGRSYYAGRGGNKAKVSPSEMVNMIHEMRSLYQNGPPQQNSADLSEASRKIKSRTDSLRKANKSRTVRTRQTKDKLVVHLGHSGSGDGSGAVTPEGISEMRGLTSVILEIEKLAEKLGLSDRIVVISGGSSNVGRDATKYEKNGGSYSAAGQLVPQGNEFIDLHFDQNNNNGKAGIIANEELSGFDLKLREMFGDFGPNHRGGTLHVPRVGGTILEVGGANEDYVRKIAQEGVTNSNTTESKLLAEFIVYSWAAEAGIKIGDSPSAPSPTTANQQSVNGTTQQQSIRDNKTVNITYNNVNNHKDQITPGNTVLTFDDGPHPQHTRDILNILKETGQKATFFVTGEKAAQYPDLVKRIAEEGHEIGIHTYKHERMTDSHITSEYIQQDIRKTQAAIDKAVGRPVQVNWFRSPYGDQNPKVLDAVNEMGLSTLLWSVDTQDWKEETSATSIFNHLQRAEGEVVLMHDGGTDTVKPGVANTRQETVDATRGFLRNSDIKTQTASEAFRDLIGGRIHSSKSVKDTTALYSIPSRDMAISEDIIEMEAKKQFEETDEVIAMTKGSLAVADEEIERLEKQRIPQVIKVGDLSQEPDLLSSNSDPYITTKPVTKKNAEVSGKESVDRSLKTTVAINFNGEDIQQNFDNTNNMTFVDSTQSLDPVFAEEDSA